MYKVTVDLRSNTRCDFRIASVVHPEPDNVPIKDPLEDCSKCGLSTNYWHTPHVPLCPTCALAEATLSVSLDTPVMDPILAEIGFGFLVVGRLVLSELIFPHVPSHLTPLLTEAVNYMVSKCEEPHTVKVICKGNPYASNTDSFIEAPSWTPAGENSSGNLLLSGGGLDSSTTALMLAKEGIPYRTIFFSFGQAARVYEWESVNFVDAYCSKFGHQADSTKLEVNLSVLRRGLSDYKDVSNEGSFPCRNWFLYFLSVSYQTVIPKNIFINVFKGEFDDNHADHSPRTFDLFRQIILAYSKADCHLLTPFKYLDKSDLAFILREYFGDLEVAKIRSCYAFFRRICGGCTGCVNKFVSLIHAGFSFEEFAGAGGSRIDPRKATKLWDKYYPRIFDDTYPDTRRAEIAYVINRFLHWKPTPMTAEEKPVFEKYLAMDLAARSTRSADAIRDQIMKALEER